MRFNSKYLNVAAIFLALYYAYSQAKNQPNDINEAGQASSQSEEGSPPAASIITIDLNKPYDQYNAFEKFIFHVMKDKIKTNSAAQSWQR